jgi:cation:H+ antiporter
MNTSVVLLLIGLLLLLGGGKYLVESSVIIARHFRIPTMIIGLTIVAFGTSAPELLVSLQAVIKGHPDMAIGNVIGSNISNILLVLASTAIIFPIAIQRNSIRRDWPIMMVISILLLVFLLDLHLMQYEGLILVILLVMYLAYSVWYARNPKNTDPEAVEIPEGTMRWWVAAILLVVSCGALALGADLLITNASSMAERMGISERVISISMVAVGTSLPELATSLIAAFKKQTNISIGNILGSNIMNILSVLGISSLIAPIQIVKESLFIDIPWMLGAAVLLLLFMLPVGRPRQYRITRIEGVAMILAYAAYIYFIFMREQL